MNKFKFFVLTNLLWHVCFLFLGMIPFMANIVGLIPVLIYSTGLSLIINKDDAYWVALRKSVLAFLVVAIPLAFEDMLLVGMLFSLPAIILAVSLQPRLVRLCNG